MTGKGRILLDELKQRIQKNVDECDHLPMEIAMAKTRTKALETVVGFMKEHDLWDQHKLRNPGEFIVISHDQNDETVICVHIGERLKKILGV